MFRTQADASEASTSAVVVDLIGDLDATLGTLAAETLARITTTGAETIFVRTKRVVIASPGGLAALEAGLSSARQAGVAVTLEAGSRKMRAAFATAQIGTADGTLQPASARHLMIARHAAGPRTRGTDLPLSA